jgi:hypothetical protein
MAEPESTLPKVFRLNTFAERRAERERREAAGELPAPRGRRYVSLGWRREFLPPAGSTGKLAEWREHEYELLFDRDHPSATFVRFTRDGVPQSVVQREEQHDRILASHTISVRPPRGNGTPSDRVVWRSTDEPDDEQR